jgi:5'-methylthioadenosine phosphorylase
MEKNTIKIGIIGGSGIDSPDILENKQLIEVNQNTTKWGKPSSPITTGTISNIQVAIIARHGLGHKINPTHVNYKANIQALKDIGCTHILGATAVGSLQEDYKPGNIVFTDQFIDRTTKRSQSFYEADGKLAPANTNNNQANANSKIPVCHISVADPICKQLQKTLQESAQTLNLSYHNSGTCVVIEGPRFSTKAESKLFQTWQAHIIGMTLVPECILAREAQIPYANISMVTDYDVWKSDEEVSTHKVIETMKQNTQKLNVLLKHVIPRIKLDPDNKIRSALNGAMF